MNKETAHNNNKSTVTCGEVDSGEALTLLETDLQIHINPKEY